MDFWGGPGAPVQQPAAPLLPPSRPVCRHFLSPTGCTRPDCAFLHVAASSAEAPVCVFYLKGACRNGAACPFRHSAAAPPPEPKAPVSLAAFLPQQLQRGGAAPAAAPEASPEAAEEEQPLEAWLLATSLRLERLSAAPASAEDFPALPSASGRATAAAAQPAPPPGSGGGLAAKLALDALARAFPGVPPAELRHCLGAAGGLVSRACALVTARNPGAVALEGALQPVRLARAAAAPPAPGGGGGGGGAPAAAPHTARGEATARAIASALPIVATGCSLARLYAACRGEAEALARARNEAFERSSRAFASGQLAQARSFGAQGQALDRRMRAAHAGAAARIFEQRNEGSGGSSSALSVQVGADAQVRVQLWDLHGLHAAEAAPLVEEGLLAAAGGSGEWVALLTGARNHSASLGRGGGSLNDGLLQHLRGQGWRVYLPMAGVLCVQL